MSTPRSASALSRRSLLAGVSMFPASALAMPGWSPAARAGDTSKSGIVRVGVIGCGGRGTGAAIQAALADPGVRVVAMADRFADQVASSATVLDRAIGDRFRTPANRRFSGPEAAAQLVGSGVDMVILAGPPSTRPDHLAAAVAAGLHVWCETPIAIDSAGLAMAATALDAAETRGLVVAAGLCSRYHAPTVATMHRIGAGAVGTIRSISLHHDGGLPWWKPLAATVSPAEQVERNWISHACRSGGAFVERHVHALDRALWLLGDDEPLAVERLSGGPAVGSDAVHVRYRFASGVIVEASCRRSATPGSGTSETVVGSRGRADLLSATIEGANEGPWRAEPCRPGEAGAMYQAGVDALLRTIRSGAPDRGESGVGTAISGRRLLRATALAVMGRMASNGDQIAWSDVCFPAATA